MPVPVYEPPGDVTAPQWTLGDRMRKSRETAGFSISAMAEHFGVHRNQVGRWESDRSRPRRHVVLQWALVTRVPLAWLEGAEEPPAPPPDQPEKAPKQPGGQARGRRGERPVKLPPIRARAGARRAA